MVERKIKVLMVEDSEADARLFELALEEAMPGVDIQTVGSLKAALGVLNKSTVDAILTDLNLPDARQMEVIQGLHEIAPTTPIVGMTGNQSKTQGPEAIRAGAQDFIAKDDVTGPFLRRVIEYAIERGAAAEAAHQAARNDLEAAAASYQVLAEAAIDGIITCDDHGEIEFANPAAGAMFGVDSAQLIGNSIRQLLSKRHRDLLAPTITKTVARRPEMVAGVLQLKAVRADGEEFPVELTITQWSFEGRPRFTANLHEITKRRDLERALERERRWFAGLVESGLESITVIKADGTRTYTSPSIKAVTGFTPEELEGVNAFARVHPDDLAKVKAELGELLAEQGGTRATEYRIQHKDGRWITVQSMAVNLLHDPAIEGIVITARDMTAQVETREALRVAEEQQRSMLESLPVGVYRTTVEGEVVRANHAAATLFGFPNVGELMATRSGEHYADPEGRKNYVRELMDANGPLVREVPFRHTSGRRIWARVQSRLVFEDGKPAYIDGTLEDITERYLAERDVHESEARFRSIYDRAPLGLVMVDDKGRPFQINPAGQAMLGYDKRTIRNQNFLEFVREDERAEAEKNFKDVISGKVEVAECEYRLVGKDGKETIASMVLTAHLNEDGEFQHMLCLLTDVTDQRAAEEALARSEFTYRRLVQNANDIILTCDMDGVIQSINPAVTRVFGADPEKAVGTNVLEFIEPSKRDDVYNDLMDLVTGSYEFPDKAYTVPAVHADGHKVWIDVQARAVENDDGAMAIHATIRDITERRRSESALRRSEEQFRTMFEASPVGIVNIDSDGRLFQCNPAARKMLGRDDTELLGQPLGALATQDKEGRELTNRLSALAAGNANHIAIHVRIDIPGGDPIWADLEAVAVRGEDGAFMHATVILQDETERITAQQLLAESEEKHRGMVDQLPIGVYRTTEDGEILHVNPAMSNIFGFDSPEEMQAHQAEDFFAREEDRLRQVERRRGGEGIYVEELAMRKKDGTEVWVRDVGRLSMGADGIRYIDGTLEDITDRKYAQLRLVQSEERFRRLYDQAPLAIFTVGPDRKIMQANPATQRMTGYTESELRKKGFADITHPDDADASRDLFTQLYNGDVDRIRLEKRYIRKDGSIMWGEVVVVAVRDQDGEFLNTISIMEDVTERREALEQVRASEQRHRELFEGVPVGLFRNRSDGTIISANPAMASIFGFDSAEAFIGHNMKEFYVDLAERERALEIIDQGLGEFEAQMRRKDGEIITIRAAATTLVVEGETVFDGNMRNVTEEKQAERERQVAAERLARINQLEEVQALRSTFLNVASHELNTPITPIVNELYMFSSGILGEMNEDQRASIRVLQRNVDRLALLVKDILDVSRIDSGSGLKLNIEDQGDLKGLITETLESFSATIEDKDLKVAKGTMSTAKVAIDERRVSQVLYNLMSNACKYTPEGGEIGIEFKKQGDEVSFTVTDSGIGMPQDKLNELFQPFSQLHDPTKVTVQSTGLGLYICRGIIEEHGGSIWAKSDGLGKGSSFGFTLPIKAQIKEEEGEEEALAA